MKKVMLIDPWGNDENKYFTGIIEPLSKNTKLTLVTRKNFTGNNLKCEVLPIFFRDNKKNNILSKIIKGVNYVTSYFMILKELKKKNYDIVHIQWLLFHKFDKYFLKLIKKQCNKLVYTAHNVFPHVDGEKYLYDLREIYKIVDSIVLHGEAVKKEFDTLFSEYSDKVYIQRHGTYLKQITHYNPENINQDIIKKINESDKVFAFVGLIFYNKGVDKLVEVWLDKFSNSNDLLIIAGKKKSKYPELEALQNQISLCSNIYYLDSYIDDDLFSFILSSADVVVLPYRHASVSGVVFSAAEFSTPVLTTNVGSIGEYLVNDENSFIVEFEESNIFSAMSKISNEISKSQLKEMGESLNKFIKTNYDWNIIVKKLVEDCYES